MTVLYAFSGYFIIFDWQFRMYTGLVTFILASYLLSTSSDSKKNFSLLLVVNTIGLFFDYGFLFYFLPIAVWLCMEEKRRSKLSAFLLSFLIFAVFWGKSFVFYFSAGLEGIAWIKDFTSPSFFIPFFLGSHSLLIFTIFFLCLLVVGIYAIFKNKKTNSWKDLLGVALFSLIFNMVISYLDTPILHVRSLQIVGIAVLILYASGLSYLYKVSKILPAALIGLFVFNCLFIVNNFSQFAGWYLISFTTP